MRPVLLAAVAAFVAGHAMAGVTFVATNRGTPDRQSKVCFHAAPEPGLLLQAGTGSVLECHQSAAEVDLPPGLQRHSIVRYPLTIESARVAFMYLRLRLVAAVILKRASNRPGSVW
jgi:hypothetical protein